MVRRSSLARAPGALKSHNAEKLKGGPFGGFFNIHSVAKHQKIEGGHFGEKIFFEKKYRSAEKNEIIVFSF